MAVNIHITIIELNALHTKRQNLFQELDAVIHLDRKSGSAGMPRPISYAVFCLKKKIQCPPEGKPGQPFGWERRGNVYEARTDSKSGCADRVRYCNACS